MPRLVRAGLHRNISLLAVAFVAVHVLTTVLDPYAGISLVSAVVPFSSPYRPLWLSLGTIAFDMLLALVADQPAQVAPVVPDVARGPLARVCVLARSRSGMDWAPAPIAACH